MSILKKLYLILCCLSFSLQACESDQDCPPKKKVVKYAKVSHYHQVKKGDTLTKISMQHQLSYLKIARWNQLKPPYKIVLGQKIKLFKRTNKIISQRVKKQKPRRYQVKKGETLYSIGRQFKINPQRIAVTNNLLAIDQLKAGKKLIIPNKKQKAIPANRVLKSKDKNKNMRFRTQKTSIISNNNESMLKFYCQWPMKGKVIRNFSKTGQRGIEIRGYIGQKVKAVANGTVVAANSSIYGHGQFVVIKHHHNYMSFYANNQRTLVKQGQKIKKGQVIAELGKIGYKRPFLTFEIRRAGRLINPMYFLPKK